MKILQLKLLEAGGCLEKYHVILILTFLWAYIYNPCPETGCWPDNSHPNPIWPFFFCYVSPTHCFYVDP